MSAKKRSARERLLDLDPEQVVREFQSGVSFKSLSFRVRRLLRAHERELAERTVKAAAPFAVSAVTERDQSEAIRAAILGPQRRRA